MYTPPPRTSVSIIGVDGSSWDLTGPGSTATLVDGLSGLHLPKTSQLWSKTARRPGQTWRGSRLESREFTVKVAVGDSDAPYRRGDDWRTLDSQFWQALSTDALATLRVNDRYLRFRLDDNEDPVFAQDPALLGNAVYSIDCIADRPEWMGDQISKAFAYNALANQNYYGGSTGLGPPFYIGEAGIFDSAAVPNPGDLPAYPTWMIVGPATRVTFGVGNRTTTLPFSLNVGDQVIIDTEAQMIRDQQGNNLWPQIGYTPVNLAPIPPGDPSPVVIAMDGAEAGASVTVSLIPLYRRAW